MIAEIIGGKTNPNIVSIEILHVSEEKWNKWVLSGKTVGEMLFENDSKRRGALDVEFNKKNQVFVASLTSSDGALAPHSPWLEGTLSQNSEESNTGLRLPIAAENVFYFYTCKYAFLTVYLKQV